MTQIIAVETAGSLPRDKTSRVLGQAAPTMPSSVTPYSLPAASKQTLSALLSAASNYLPPGLSSYLSKVSFTSQINNGQGDIYFPCPFKEVECAAALKALEASLVAAIADLRFGKSLDRRIEINMEGTANFLFSTYIATIGGLEKGSEGVKDKLKDTDLRQAQSILYRRLSANLYETKLPGVYFHIHGSLEASKTLNMLDLEAHRPDLTDYRQAIDTIESRVKQFTAAELEEMNAREKQAGVTVYKWEGFQKMPHGKTMLSMPPYEVHQLENKSPPAPFPATSRTDRPLAGIRVLELCRIIAGPAIGRTLAEYGASVIKVTSPSLSDVPFFQVDGNVGKHTVDLDLKSPSGRAAFEELLLSADVILNGYRPGAIEKLGYGPEDVVKFLKGKGRENGVVYVSEDCFGPQGEWAGRPGWQQIADCVTGVAWEQGRFMGLDEPVVPPFPMSDYGTGCLGAIAALTGLFRRATEGGSWVGTTSLCQYDVFLLKQGLYGEEMKRKVREKHDEEFFGLRHADSVDEVGKRALRSMKRCYPELFADSMLQKGWSRGFGEEIKWARSGTSIDGVKVGFERSSRPNGFDEPTWDDWEVELEVLEG